MTDEGTHYPDLEPDGLGDLKSIKRIPGIQTPAPRIRWGDDYLGWPIAKRLQYAERLASTMNHAADVLQTERNNLLETVRKQEEQLKHASIVYLAQGDTMHKELGIADAEKQALYREIVALKSELKALKRGSKH